MMFSKMFQKMVFLLPLGLVIYASSAQAWDHHGRDLHYRGHWHNHGYFPSNYLSVRFGGEPYYYYNGYYTNVDTDYAVISPGVGSVILALPNAYHQVVIDGRIYYMHDGIYYQRIASGYQVVEPPVDVATPVVVQPTAVTQPPATAGTTTNVATVANGPVQDEFLVNIPNSQGGYTAVTIKKAKNGFTGPQGEFYAEFPKVDQLKAMYAK